MMYTKYINKPWKLHGKLDSYDCWTLVVDIYKTELNIDVEFNDNYHVQMNQRSKDIGNIISSLKGKFININNNDIKPYDIILFNIGKYPVHVGMVIDNKYMIHSTKHTGSIIERHTKNKWKTRIEGYYRWDCM